MYAGLTLAAAWSALSVSPANAVSLLVSSSTFARSVPVTVSVSIGPEVFAANPTV